MTKKFRDYLPDYFFLISIAGLVLLFDQGLKTIVRQNLAFGERWLPAGMEWLAPYARIVNWRNTGAAFGIFRDAGLVFAVLAVVVTLVILIYFPVVPKSDWHLRLALSMQLGGAMGNLTDRLLHGWVTDFVSVGNLPVFNVADASISIGVVLLLVPYIPLIPKELDEYRLSRRAKGINPRRRNNPIPRSPDSQDEAFSLGILEVAFRDSPQIRSFVTSQRVKRLRHKYLSRFNGSAGKKRQSGNSG